MCDQHSLRSACAYGQSDQSLCLSLEFSMTVKLLTEHHLEFLSLKGGCSCLSESTLVKMSHCWKSHVAVQLLLFPFLSLLSNSTLNTIPTSTLCLRVASADSLCEQFGPS